MTGADAAPDRTRAYLITGRIWFALFCLFIAIGATADWPLPVLLIGGAVIAVGAVVLLRPRRPWWGPGPSATFSNRDRRRAIQRREAIYEIVIFLVLVIAVPLVLGLTGVLGSTTPT